MTASEHRHDMPPFRASPTFARFSATKTEPDEQFAKWTVHAHQANVHLANAYPTKYLVEQTGEWRGKTAAIRGLGLSVFDVIRALTTAQGGCFHSHGYSASGREPRKIIPFSLDGKPPFPKPETESIDALFDLLPYEFEAFSDALDRAVDTDPKTAAKLITAALVPAVDRVMRRLETPANTRDIIEWLETEWASPGSQETESSLETLILGIGFADGSRMPTLGYAIGQIWRKLQDRFRSGFNLAEVEVDTAVAIANFDDGIKRYSYGPPVSSAREMLTLVNAGILDLSFATDPKIELTDAGWKLNTDGKIASASVMINAVLPSSDLLKIVDVLVCDLISQQLLRPVSEGFGAKTAAVGRLVDGQGEPLVGLCFLGRLALGSVVAVDSLDNCFGEDASRWATGVLNRLGFLDDATD
ncbi:hypothetical protein ACFSUD_15540 [Sulfitobacter aestuarii]|uniref:Uncharacterized protein n=1 Tax=Sulfitobacter aestuarii TaxID=2161676 RepID=A0ABW5U702_9RHOB